MNPDSSQPKINLSERFPKMRPITSPPTLTTINGFGLGVYGRRDEDPDTGTYVKTQCFCALFIPLFALGAYRVADAPDRAWYFLGKEPLSGFAKLWNGFVLCLLLVGTGGLTWNSYVSSPEYRAKQELRAGRAQLAAGDALKAADTFSRLIGGSAVDVEAREGLGAALEQCVRSSSSVANEGAFRILARIGTAANRPTPLVPDAFKRGLTLIEKWREEDPEGALRLYASVAALEPKDASLPALRIGLLKQSIAARPDNTNRVVELAVIYEKAEQMDECQKLLLPYRARLGATEGARILGQQLLRDGRYDDAYTLLHPYVQSRLTHLHSLERSYTNAIARSYDGALEFLRKGHAPRSFYDQYERAAKTEKDEMVENFVQDWMKKDATYQRALTQLTEANQIVHVTLDLGIVQLNRAQGFTDPAARKTELEAAEKTFLAIRGMAGETDEYRLFLGQVYYWLGKSKEGKELFDQLLASKNRSFQILLSLARTLREVGELKQAREILEEAYRIGKAGKEKYAAASLRAMTSKDSADKISWLEKTDTTEVSAQIALNDARGDQALEQGNKELAAQYLRKAIAGYESLPKSAATLNNAGLTHFSLYEVTGRVEDHNRGLALLEQAISLDPGNSIQLINATQILFSRAVMDLARDSLRLDLIKESPGFEMLPYLYDDEPGRVALMQRLRANEHMKKALIYLDKALLLAPKTRSLYQEQLALQAGFQDFAELQKLQQRIRTAQLDDAEIRKEATQAYGGAKDKEYSEKFQAQIKKHAALLETAAVKQHPLTLAYVSTTLINLRQNAAIYGATADSQQLLSSAEVVVQKVTNSAARGSLLMALYFRAQDEVSRQNPEFAALARKSARAVSPRYLIASLLERGGPMADVLRQNANIQRALKMEKENGRRFPQFRSPEEWALFRAADPGEADAVARTMKENATARLVEQLQFQLSPASGSTVLDQYWTRKVNGDEKGAEAFYQDAIRQGVPLPNFNPNANAAAKAASPAGKLANRE